MSSRFLIVLISAFVLFCPLSCMQMTMHAAPLPDQVVSSVGPDEEVKQFRLDELESTLRTMPAGPEHDYFAGVLANRAGRPAESIRLLNDALPGIREDHPARAAVALEALADDYIKSFRYADAAQTYDDLLTHFTSQMSSAQLQGTKDDSGVAHLLRLAPAQTIAWQGPTRLKTERNLIGSLVTNLTVNGVQEPWLLDTGANMSVVSQSFARKLGLTPIPGFGQTMAGVTGIENPLQVAVLPTLQVGGATLHNVALLILDDANLKIRMGKQAYQIDAIIGYPVFQALGAITFLHDNEFEAGDTVRRPATGTRMYMKLLMPVIECGVEGKMLPFSFDTGASGTNLSIRYYRLFRGQTGSWKKGRNESFGAGGVRRRKIYIQPKLKLAVGNETATLNRVPIFTTPMGSDIDELYGNLGQDLVAAFESFTQDFSKMTFSLGSPIHSQSRH